jgi:hypothetical protein
MAKAKQQDENTAENQPEAMPESPADGGAAATGEPEALTAEEIDQRAAIIIGAFARRIANLANDAHQALGLLHLDDYIGRELTPLGELVDAAFPEPHQDWFDAVDALCRKITHRATPAVLWSHLVLEKHERGEMRPAQRTLLTAYSFAHAILREAHRNNAAFIAALTRDDARSRPPLHPEDTTLAPVDGLFDKAF